MRKFFLALLSVFILIVLPVATYAANARAEEAQSRKEEIKERIEAKKQEIKAKIASRAALRREKLAEVKKKVCETKQRNIIRRSENMAKRADKQFDVFGNIADRVDTYYTDKLVPQGKVLPNYQSLKDEIAAKEEAAQAAVEAALDAAKNFDCEGDDPKGQLTQYREYMQEVIKALKEFRTSIKNFIVAVRTLNAKGGDATNSATQSSDSD